MVTKLIETIKKYFVNLICICQKIQKNSYSLYVKKNKIILLVFKKTLNWKMLIKKINILLQDSFNLRKNKFLIFLLTIPTERTWSSWFYENTWGLFGAKPSIFIKEPIPTSRTWTEYISSLIYGEKSPKVFEVVEVINRPINFDSVNRQELVEIQPMMNSFLTFQKHIARQVRSCSDQSQNVVIRLKDIISRSEAIIDNAEVFMDDLNFESIDRRFGTFLLVFGWFIKGLRLAICKNVKLAEGIKEHPFIFEDAKNIAFKLKVNTSFFVEARVEYEDLIKLTIDKYYNLLSALIRYREFQNFIFFNSDEDTLLWHSGRIINTLKDIDLHRKGLKECLHFWELSIAKNSANLQVTEALIRSFESRARYINDAIANTPEMTGTFISEIPVATHSWLWSFLGKGVLVCAAVTAMYFLLPVCLQFKSKVFVNKTLNFIPQSMELPISNTSFFSNNFRVCTSPYEEILWGYYQYISHYYLGVSFTVFLLIFYWLFYFFQKLKI